MEKNNLPIEYGIPLGKIGNKRNENRAKQKHCVGKLVSLRVFSLCPSRLTYS